MPIPIWLWPIVVPIFLVMGFFSERKRTKKFLAKYYVGQYVKVKTDQCGRLDLRALHGKQAVIVRWIVPQKWRVSDQASFEGNYDVLADVLGYGLFLFPDGCFEGLEHEA